MMMATTLFFISSLKNICFTLTFSIFILLLNIAPLLTSSPTESPRETPGDGSQPTSWVHTIQMPNITTNKEDKYLCIDYDFPIKLKHFLTGFEAKPDNPNVHHMLLFACSGQAQKSKAFECLGSCFSERIYFAWGRNAPPTNLPKGVGFKLATDGIDFLRYQVHYKTIVNTSDQSSLKLTFTTDPQPYTAGVLLMLKNYLKIPAHKKLTVGNVSCKYDLQANMYPIAFRVHAHMLGRVISAYVKKSSGWKLIGKGNPQWPQAFWPTNDKELVIEKGDFIAAKCVYNSEHYDVDVNIGSTHNDEMCNFYLMYYKNSSDSGEVNFCQGDDYPDISRDVPDFALEELPPNPDLEDVGEGHKHDHHHMLSNTSTEAHINISLSPALNWPLLPNGMELGEVTGLATNQFGFVYLFHRGNAKWMPDSFDENFKYTYRDQPPIQDNTILKVNISSGEVVKMFGKNIFYMPHGIFVDHDGAIWLTDVAMHNVIKFPATLEDDPQTLPSLTLGERFIPGLDNVHFCKPTDVVVALTGEVYVSDGYCNSRVIAFDRFGNFLRVWRVGEDENGYYLPHSISMDVQAGTIFVASRASHSLFIYSVAGEFKKKITSDDFIPELFSVAYNQISDKLFCLNGNLVNFTYVYDLRVAVVDQDSEIILSKWSVPNVTSPKGSTHDIAVSPDGKNVFVAYVGKPGYVYKFEDLSDEIFELNHKSVKKAGLPTYHRHLISKETSTSFFDDPLKYNITTVSLILLCFLIIPISILICVTLYLKKRKRNQHTYSHLEAAHQSNRRLANKNKPASLVKNFVRGKMQEKSLLNEEELRRLESDSEEEYKIPDIDANKM